MMSTPDPLHASRPRPEAPGNEESESQPDGSNGGKGGGMRPYDPRAAAGGISLPFAAMAEALRANAEALRRIDANQRKIAEAVRKNDKATQVVTSTRNLNETFRGLSEIQRGLLDALVKDRRGHRGAPLVLVGMLLLAGLLALLFYEWRFGGETISEAVYQNTVSRADRLARENESLSGAVQQAQRDAEEWKTRLDERAGLLGALEREKIELGGSLRALEEELSAKEASLKEFLVVKDMADRAGTVMARNTRLEGEIRDLRGRLERAESERERLMNLVAGQKMAALDGNADDLIERAKQMGLIEGQPEIGPDGGPVGPIRLAPRVRRRVVMQINRLLRQATGGHAYELLDFGAMRDRSVLVDVRVARYLDAQMVSTLICKELEIVLDPDGDTLELRMRSGYIENFGRPGEQIPFADDGHSVFLKELGLESWLRRVAHSIMVGKDGMLTWKTTPS